MSAAAVTRRWWRSLIGARYSGPAPARTAGRGRDGYRLRLRVWASFIGLDLPPTPLQAVPARAASANLPEPALPGTTPRNGQQVDGFTQGWFPLPPLPALGGLTAAGSDAIALETASPDGRVRFLVRTRGNLRAEYSLELVLHDGDAALPMLAAVRYPGADGGDGGDGGEQVLLVPVMRGRLGPAASYVRLPGFAADTAWAAHAPVPVTSSTTWEAATIAGSVRAALNEATRDAWRRVAELVADDLRGVIEGELP